MTNLETQLRKAARTSGISMKQMSDRAAIPYAAIHRFVAGDQGITLTTASKLATLLGLELRPVKRRTKRG